MKITLNKNIYLYGIYYDTNKVNFPTEEENWTGIIIYTSNIKKEKFTSLSSLEGFFISDIDLRSYHDNLICRKNDMNEFEEKCQGKFVPFGK